MRKTIITTAGRPNEHSMRLAKYAASFLSYEVVPRNKRSITKMQSQYDANVIVSGKERFEYFPYGQNEPFFYHPNSAAYRVKRLANGLEDPLVEACGLQEGDHFLDCTLGIGSDSLVAAYVVGVKGRVVGLEANPNVAFIVKVGMSNYPLDELPILSPMRTIEVVHTDATIYLKKQPTKSFDVVYIDPMFDQMIEESNNFSPLRSAGNHDLLTSEWVEEAKRVARKKVVLKAHYLSQYFEQFGFTQIVRKTSKFHYGIIDI